MANPNRTSRELDDLLRGAAKVSGGAAGFTILAHSEEEAAQLRDMMRGRHGLKAVDVRVAAPEEFVPIMDRVRGEL